MFRPEIIMSGVTESALYVLLATSFMIIYRVSRVLHFAHGTAFLVGAYAGVAVYGATNIVVAAVTAMVAGALFGCGCDKLVYAPLLRRGATPFAVVISSLAIFILGENVVGMIFGGQVRVARDSWLQKRPPLTAGVPWLHWMQVVMLASAIVWVICLRMTLARTRIGIFMRGVASNEPLAAWTGVPTTTVRTAAFLLGSAVVAFAGLMKYLYITASPTMDLVGTLYAIIPFIIGGMSSLGGIAIASGLLGFGGVGVSLYLGSQWSDVAVFAFLAVVLVIRPQGLSFGRT
jgi:branched-chain amino acid transport system permease protein